MANKKYYKSKESLELVIELKQNEDFVEEDASKWEQITKAQYDALVEIQQLKLQLARTDYQALKYAEGWISEQDYAPIKAQRQALRDQINELEQELN